MSDKTYTAEEVAALMAKPKRALPAKLSETGAQTAYTGILSQIVITVVWLLGHLGVLDVTIADELVVGGALALIGGGGAYRTAAKRQQTSAEANTILAQDIGALPDEDEYGPER